VANSFLEIPVFLSNNKENAVITAFFSEAQFTLVVSVLPFVM